MLLILIDIFIQVRIHKRNLIQPAPLPRVDNRTNHQKNIQLQMFILMLSSISIFLMTTLPLAIYKITSVRDSNFLVSIPQVTSIWTGLGWFQSLNYAVSIVSNQDLHIFRLFVGEFLQSLSYFNIISKRIKRTNELYAMHHTNSSGDNRNYEIKTLSSNHSAMSKCRVFLKNLCKY
jgi:ABC-type multidrug transport system fused ATPase/permease subunit